MTSRSFPSLVVSSFLLLAATSLAQEGNAPPSAGEGADQPRGRGQDGPGGRPPRPPIDTTLDANGDEVIDATEIGNAPAALAKIDRNGDGRLTSDEYLPVRPGAPGPDARPGGNEAGSRRPPQGGAEGGRRKPPLATAIDLDGDGILAAAEISGSPAALRKLDRNGDGKLSPDEYRPPRPGAGGRSEAAGAEGERPPSPPADRPRPDGRQAAQQPKPQPQATSISPGMAITGVTLAFDPSRLFVSGSGFRQGATVTINGVPSPGTTFRSAESVVVSGPGLEKMLPKGAELSIVVVNPDGGSSSPWSFRR
jgi:hypothetical protein